MRFEISGDSVLVLFRAASDAPTVVCLTSHAYFNLDGADTIEEHQLRVDAEEFLSVDDTGIPLAERTRVAGTAFDLRQPTQLGDRIRDPHPQMAAAQGIDHCFVLDGVGRRRVATLDSQPQPDEARAEHGPAGAAGLHGQPARRDRRRR